MTLIAHQSQSFTTPIAVDEPVKRFTISDVLAMVKAGILPEDGTHELLDGVIVRKLRNAAGEDPMSVGNSHRFATNQFTNVAGRFDGLGCFCQTQQPIQIIDDGLPEPDASVIRGTERDYLSAIPTSADVLCCVEVAESSINRDRTTKLRIYASAAIQMYVVVDLNNDSALVYRDPQTSGTYGNLVTLRGRDVLHLPTATDETVDIVVATLFT